MDGQNSYLIPYEIGSFGFAYGNGQEAPENDWSIDLHTATDKFDPARIAYELAKEIYFWFGHSEEVIPYVTTLPDGLKRIDVDQIANIR